MGWVDGGRKVGGRGSLWAGNPCLVARFDSIRQDRQDQSSLADALCHLEAAVVGWSLVIHFGVLGLGGKGVRDTQRLLLFLVAWDGGEGWVSQSVSTGGGFSRCCCCGVLCPPARDSRGRKREARQCNV